MGKLTMSPEEFADKQARNLKNSTEDIKRGVEAVTISPGVKAAQNIDKMKLNFNNAIDSGKTKKALENIDLSDWQKKTIEKGIPRISQGIDGARDKVVAFASALFPHIRTGLQKIEGMKSLTFEDNINRMVAWARHMKTFSYK